MLWLAWACALAASSAATAQTPAPSGTLGRAPGDTVLVLPEVRVEERRPSDAERRLPSGFVSEIRAGSRGAAMDLLPELLGQLPGLHVEQYGGLGAFSVVSVRGSSPGQVAVFLDGSPLTSASHGVVSLSDLPLAAIERIEVYRGASPLGMGPPGAAGAVNFVTWGGPSVPQLRVTRGSFDTWDARGALQAHLGSVRARLHAGYQGSEGDFAYRDDNATPFNPADDTTMTRVNNRFDAWTGLASLDWHPHRDVSVTARGDVFHRRQGLPGLGAVPTRHAGLEFERTLTQIEATSAPSGRARPQAWLRVGRAVERTRFEDLQAELGLGAHDTDDRAFSDHADFELEWLDLPGSLGLETAGSWRREEARLHDGANGFDDPVPSVRRGLGGTLGLRARPLAGRVLIRAAERWDRVDDALRSVGVAGTLARDDVSRTLRSPQLGTRVDAGLGLELRANWSKADRAPDFLELFGNQGSVLGNASLEPERVESWDAGAMWASPAHAPISATATWAHFESRSRDLILYVRNSASTVRAQNISAARVRGEELGLTLAGWDVRLAGSFTWQSAVDAGDVPYWTGKRLPQRPGREGYARLSWRRNALGVGADVHYLGDNFLDRYNRYRLGSRTLAGAWASVSPGAWPVTVIVEGKNLGNQRAADVAGFPLPGRSLFVACESRLGPSPR